MNEDLPAPLTRFMLTSVLNRPKNHEIFARIIFIVVAITATVGA
jgi:hypothetical protein